MISTLASLLVFFKAVQADDLSWSEAQEIVNGKRIVFVADSVQRYCFFGLNYWLATGELPDDEYDSAWGNNDEDYNTDLHADVWDTDGVVSDRGQHRQWLSQDFPQYGDAYTTFYFVQDVWYDDLEDEIKDDIVNNYDVIVWNVGWWRLKPEADPADCGEDWTNECESEWEDSLQDIKDNMFDELIDNGGQVLLRSSTCCGEGSGDSWVDSIEDLNEVTEDFFDGESGYTYVNVYDLVDTDNQDDKLFDGRHLDRDTCLEFNKRVLRAVDSVTERSSSSSGSSSGATNYSPTYQPTSAEDSSSSSGAYSPSYQPTYTPTSGED